MAESIENPEIVSFEQARRIVEEHVARLKSHGSENVPLLRSSNRVLAEPVFADRDFPPFSRATRDGYAVRSVDLTKIPIELQVVGEIRAGAHLKESFGMLRKGEAAEIMTGAPVPEGADAVVMVEYTSRNGLVVVLRRGVSAGENVVPRGAEAKEGDQLLSVGTRLNYASIAVAASAGKADLRVFARPRIAILSTGDEVVDVCEKPGPSQIRNSNSYSLAVQTETSGAQPMVLPIAPDSMERLRELIKEGLAADLLVIAGGVSMGKYDLVEQVLKEFGAEFFFTGALIQPGRPVVFGRVPVRQRSGQDGSGEQRKEQWVYFFGLPGNPVSTMVTFELFVRPVISALSGAKPGVLKFVQAKLRSEIRTRTGLTRFLPALLSGEYDRSEVELIRWQGSGDVGGTAAANCYIVITPDRERIAAGEMVNLLLRVDGN